MEFDVRSAAYFEFVLFFCGVSPFGDVVLSFFTIPTASTKTSNLLSRPQGSFRPSPCGACCFGLLIMTTYSG